MSDPRVLILTLFSGENELPESVAALESQSWSRREHKIFRYLPNLEAHQTLYDCIMNAVNEYDLFVKLDADMVFNRTTVLADIVDEFIRHKDLDHAVFSVRDWASATDIMGLHVYSNRVKWSHDDESLFVDPRPEIPGERRLYWNAPAPVADHMPNPSLEQARLFGYHRALKLVQRHRLRKNVEQAETQWNLLQGVWQAWKSTGEPRRAAVLQGAEHVFAGKDKVLVDKSEVGETVDWGDGQDSEQKQLDGWLRAHWRSGNPIVRWRYWRWVQLPRWLRRLFAIVRFRRPERGKGK